MVYDCIRYSLGFFLPPSAFGHFKCRTPLRKVSLRHFSLFGRCVRAAAMCAVVDSLQHLQLSLPYINNDR